MIFRRLCESRVTIVNDDCVHRIIRNDHQICRLYVPVHDAVAMEVCEALQSLVKSRKSYVVRQLGECQFDERLLCQGRVYQIDVADVGCTGRGSMSTRINICYEVTEIWL